MLHKANKISSHFFDTRIVWTTLLNNERHIWELKILKDISYDTFFKRNFEKIIILRLNKSIYFMLINNTDAITFNIENINWRFFDVAFSCTANMLDGDFAYSVIRNLLNYLRKTNPIPFLNSSMHLKCCSTALRPYQEFVMVIISKYQMLIGVSTLGSDIIDEVICG